MKEKPFCTIWGYEDGALPQITRERMYEKLRLKEIADDTFVAGLGPIGIRMNAYVWRGQIICDVLRKAKVSIDEFVPCYIGLKGHGYYQVVDYPGQYGRPVEEQP